MLVLSRNANEAIIITDLTTGAVTTVRVLSGDGRIKLGIEASIGTRIDREEIHLQRLARQTEPSQQEQVG